MKRYRRWKRVKKWEWTQSGQRLPLWARILWRRLHYCPDWDYLVIDANDPEYSGCVCFTKRVAE